MYLSIAQMNPAVANFAPPADFRIGIQAAQGSAVALTRAVTAAIGQIEPELRVTVRTAASYVDGTMTTERLTAILAGLFGSLALLLAGVGIFGVTAYVVLAAVAWLAGWLPARRAARIDPAVVLRNE